MMFPPWNGSFFDLKKGIRSASNLHIPVKPVKNKLTHPPCQPPTMRTRNHYPGVVSSRSLKSMQG